MPYLHETYSFCEVSWHSLIQKR